MGVNVLQKTAVMIHGLPTFVSSTDISNYFGKFGKLCHVVMDPENYLPLCCVPIVHQNVHYDKDDDDDNAQRKKNEKTNCEYSNVYIAYTNEKSAAMALKEAENFKLDKRTEYIDFKETHRKSSIKATYAWTKYCESFLNGKDCKDRDCLYLHEELNRNLDSQKIMISSPVTKSTGERNGAISGVPILDKKTTRVSPDSLDKSSVALVSLDGDILPRNKDNVARRLFNPPIGSRPDHFLSTSGGEKAKSRKNKPATNGINSPWQIQSPIIIPQESELMKSNFGCVSHYPPHEVTISNIPLVRSNGKIAGQHSGDTSDSNMLTNNQSEQDKKFLKEMVDSNSSLYPKQSYLLEDRTLPGKSVPMLIENEKCPMPPDIILVTQQNNISKNNPKKIRTVLIPPTFHTNNSNAIYYKVHESKQLYRACRYPASNYPCYGTNAHIIPPKHVQHFHHAASHNNYSHQPNLAPYNPYNGAVVPAGFYPTISHPQPYTRYPSQCEQEFCFPQTTFYHPAVQPTYHDKRLHNA